MHIQEPCTISTLFITPVFGYEPLKGSLFSVVSWCVEKASSDWIMGIDQCSWSSLSLSSLVHESTMGQGRCHTAERAWRVRNLPSGFSSTLKLGPWKGELHYEAEWMALACKDTSLAWVVLAKVWWRCWWVGGRHAHRVGFASWRQRTLPVFHTPTELQPTFTAKC